jgi:Zn-dependent protease
MFGGLRLGTYAGAPIILDWSVLILAAFLVLGGVGAGGVASLPFAIITLVAVLLAIFIHEMGHAVTAAAFRIPNRRIVLTGFGGFVELVWKPAHRSQDIAISAAGPFANLACAALAWLLTKTLSPAFDAEAFNAPLQFLDRFGQISLMLGVFNLLPGFPLDGGHIVRVALGYRMRETTAGMITAWIGVAIGAYLAFAGFATQAYWALGVGLYLASAAYEETRRLGGRARR